MLPAFNKKKLKGVAKEAKILGMLLYYLGHLIKPLVEETKSLLYRLLIEYNIIYHYHLYNF